MTPEARRRKNQKKKAKAKLKKASERAAVDPSGVLLGDEANVAGPSEGHVTVTDTEEQITNSEDLQTEEGEEKNGDGFLENEGEEKLVESTQSHGPSTEDQSMTDVHELQMQHESAAAFVSVPSAVNSLEEAASDRQIPLEQDLSFQHDENELGRISTAGIGSFQGGTLGQAQESVHNDLSRAEPPHQISSNHPQLVGGDLQMVSQSQLEQPQSVPVADLHAEVNDGTPAQGDVAIEYTPQEPTTANTHDGTPNDLFGDSDTEENSEWNTIVGLQQRQEVRTYEEPVIPQLIHEEEEGKESSLDFDMQSDNKSDLQSDQESALGAGEKHAEELEPELSFQSEHEKMPWETSLYREDLTPEADVSGGFSFTGNQEPNSEFSSLGQSQIIGDKERVFGNGAETSSRELDYSVDDADQTVVEHPFPSLAPLSEERRSETRQEPVTTADDLFGSYGPDEEPLWNTSTNDTKTEVSKEVALSNPEEKNTPLSDRGATSTATAAPSSSAAEAPRNKFSFLEDDQDLLLNDDDDSFLESDEEPDENSPSPAVAASQVSPLPAPETTEASAGHQPAANTKVRYAPPFRPTNVVPQTVITNTPAIGIVPPQPVLKSNISSPRPQSLQSFLPSPKIDLQQDDDTLKKINAEKKKSDAYDFPMDFITTKVKPVHAKPVGVPTLQFASPMMEKSASKPPISGHKPMPVPQAKPPNAPLPPNPYARVAPTASTSYNASISPSTRPAGTRLNTSVPRAAPSVNSPRSPYNLMVGAEPNEGTLNYQTHASQRSGSNSGQPARRLSVSKYAPVLNSKPPTSAHPPQSPSGPLPAIYQFPQSLPQNSQIQQLQNEKDSSARDTPLSASGSPYIQAVGRQGHARKRSSLYTPNQTNATARYAPTVKPQLQQQQISTQPVSSPLVYPLAPGMAGSAGVSPLAKGSGAEVKYSGNAASMTSSLPKPTAAVPEQHIDNQVLLNCQFPVFHWETSDKVVFGIPTETNYYTGSVSSPLSTINISDYQKIVKVEDYVKNFPGPLTPKSKKADVEKWIETAIVALKPGDHTLKHTVWSLLKLKISGSGDLKTISKLLYDSDELLSFLAQPLVSTNAVPNAYKLDQNSQMRVLALLQTGNAEGALQLALDKKDFSMALLIGSLVGKDKWSTVVEEYLNQEFTGSANIWAGLLSIIFQVFIGNSKVAVGELYSNTEASAWAIANWKVIVAAVLINVEVSENKPKGDSLEIPPVVVEFLVEFGIFLNQRGETLAAAILFMITDIPLSNDPVLPDSDVRFRYIGTPNNIESLFWAELYEYYFKLSNPKKEDFIVTFAQKLSHAYILEELGLSSQASRYADHLTAKCKAMPKNDPFSVNVLCRLTGLNNRISETNSGWLGKPKLSSVWGHLDKSFNKYIGGDDEVEVQKTAEAKIFDNLSATSSRNSSAVDITQQFTPYNANRNAALERGSQSRKAVHHNFYEIGNVLQPPRMNLSGQASPTGVKSTASSLIDGKLHSPVTVTAVQPVGKKSVRQPPTSREVRPHILARTATDIDYNTKTGFVKRATSGISAPPKIAHRETYFKSSPDLSAGVESFQQPTSIKPKKATRQLSRYTPVNAAEPSQLPQPTIASAEIKSDNVAPVKSDKGIIPSMSPSKPAESLIDSRLEVTGSPMGTLPQAQMDVQPPHIGNIYPRDSVSSTISEELEISPSSRVLNQPSANTDTLENGGLYRETIMEEKAENNDTITEDSMREQDPNVAQEASYDTDANVKQPLAPIQDQQDAAFDNIGNPVGDDELTNTEHTQGEESQSEVNLPPDVKQKEIEQILPNTMSGVVPRADPTKSRRSSSRRTSYLPNIASNIDQPVGSSGKNTFSYAGYSPFSPSTDIQDDAVNNMAHHSTSDIGPLDKVPGISPSISPAPPMGQVRRISSGTRSEVASHEQGVTPRVVIPRPPVTEKFAPIREQEAISDGTLEPVIKKTSGSNFKTYSPRVILADEREYNDVVEDESDEENEDAEIKKGGAKVRAVDADDMDNDDDTSKKSRKPKSTESAVAGQQKSGWFGWLKKDTGEKKAIKAKLGHENTFYFDEKLKRWVNKNATEEEKKMMMESAAPPPPPIIKRKNVEPKTKPRLSVSLSTHPKVQPMAASVLPTNPLTGEKMATPQPSVRTSPAPPSQRTATPSGSDVSLAGKKANGLDDLLNISSTTSRRKKRPGRGYVNVMEKI